MIQGVSEFASRTNAKLDREGLNSNWTVNGVDFSIPVRGSYIYFSSDVKLSNTNEQLMQVRIPVHYVDNHKIGFKQKFESRSLLKLIGEEVPKDLAHALR